MLTQLTVTYDCKSKYVKGYMGTDTVPDSSKVLQSILWVSAIRNTDISLCSTEALLSHFTQTERQNLCFVSHMHAHTDTDTDTHTHTHTHTHTWFAHVENWPFQCPMRPADAAVPGPCLPHSQWGTWCHISKQQKKLQQSHKELPEKIMPVYHRPKSTGKRNKCHQNAHSAKAKLHRKNSQRSYYVRSVNLRVRPSNQLSMTVTIHSCPWL